ncbi:Ion-translocating oxidoreductase complex subunit E [Burkholderiales bacterium]|nr:MAG: electron transport complex subunit E [Burkholderiales bacterium]CAG0989660.1 Ion-translocating oxidoreductase complex subunit E [Burkholderiales bacterium]
MNEGSWPYAKISADGLWRQNAGLVQLLGLCPLLAISTSLVNGVSLGLATALVMALASGGVAAVRHLIPNEIRIPIFIVIIAVLVTVVEMMMNVHLRELYVVLGIFIPLIVTNCVVLARVEAFAAKTPVLPSMVDGLMMGLGLTLVLAMLGGMREIIGQGTLFAGIDLVFPGTAPLVLLGRDYPGFLLAILPPGAFIGLGLMIAGKNWLDEHRARARPLPKRAPQAV